MIFAGYRWLWAFPLAVIALILFGAYRANINVEKITDPTVIALPYNLKQKLLTEPRSELLYVDYHNKKIGYYFRSRNEVRCNIILKVMQEMIVSLRFNLPEGSYLFVLHDGAHHIYGWPILAYATKEKFLADKEVFLIPDPYATTGYKSIFEEMDKNINKYKWQNKISQVFWRGSAFGVGAACNDLNGCDRFRFMNYAAKLEFADVGFTSYTSQLNNEFKERLAAIHGLKKHVNPVNSMAYKYLIDIDGNSCSYSRMAWILYSNSVLMKHKSDLLQWYYPSLQPGVHYLPINSDFSNLQEQFMWAEAHPKEAIAIAENGRRFAKIIFSHVDILKSMEQAFLQYHNFVADLEAKALSG